VRDHLTVAAAVALLWLFGPCTAARAAADQSAGNGCDDPAEAAAADPGRGPDLERSDRGVLRTLLEQEFRVTGVLWPGSLGDGVDPFWAEVEYRPRVTGKRARLSAAAELLFRATMSGPLDTRDSASGNAGRRSLRVQPDRQGATIKELSLSLDTPVDVAIGWQIFNWGHGTDGIRALDVFERYDLTDRLRPEQLGVPAVSASFGHRGWEAEGVWVPGAPTDKIAAASSNVWYPFPRSPRFAAPVDSAPPTFSLSSSQAGIRVGRYGQHGDLAIVAARADDETPSVVEFVPGASAGVLRPSSLFKRYWLVGGSVVQTAGNYLLRAEVLHATYSEPSGTLARNGVRGVAGIERRITAGVDSRYTLIAQYAVDTTGSEAVLQAQAFVSSPFRVYRHAITASATSAWREQYELETRILRALEYGSTVASAKLSYRRSDHVTLWVAGDYVDGRHGTWLQQLDAADRVLAGVNVHP
jgi:hypothetical protein